MRFMEHIFSAFRQKREPLTTRTNSGLKTEKEEDEGDGDGPDSANDAEAIEKSLRVFERLFHLLLLGEPSARNAMVAFDLTHYICGRLQPDINRVKHWLGRMIPALLKTGVPTERRDDVTATILLNAGASAERNDYRSARDSLIRMNIDFSASIPSTDGVSGFSAVLPQSATATDVWSRVQNIRTYREQACAYLRALNCGKQSSEYGELAKEAVEEWPVMEGAFRSPSARNRILELNGYQDCCPTHQISLPTREAFKLRTLRVATAKNCCRNVIVWTGN
jgi:hypothetical protein